jgi:Tfp pilus assembly protein PilO
MALELRNKNVLLNLAVIVVACIVAFNFVYKKQDKELQDLKSKVETEQNKNVVLANIGQMEGKIEGFKNLLPKRDESEVINTISNLATEAGIRITGIRPSQTQQQTPDYTKSIFEMTLTVGNYHALGKFLSRLESYKDVFIVDNVNIATQEPSKELITNIRVSTIAFADKK